MPILASRTGTQKGVALVAFLFMAALPSYVDWEQSPEKRPQIVGLYGVAVGLFWYGFLK